MNTDKELKKLISTHKGDYVGNFLTLLCMKKFGEDWDNYKEIESLMLHLKYQRSEIFEALYDYAYEKLSIFLNEDGTGTENCKDWKELL